MREKAFKSREAPNFWQTQQDGQTQTPAQRDRVPPAAGEVSIAEGVGHGSMDAYGHQVKVTDRNRLIVQKRLGKTHEDIARQLVEGVDRAKYRRLDNSPAARFWRLWREATTSGAAWEAFFNSKKVAEADLVA